MGIVLYSDTNQHDLPCVTKSTSSTGPFNVVYLVGFVARPLGSLDLLLVFIGSLVDFGPLLFVHFLELCEVTPAGAAPHHRATGEEEEGPPWQGRAVGCSTGVQCIVIYFPI